MGQYKVCVYAISKNEAQFVDRWMDAVAEADLVVVTDTGSTDDTVQKLRSRGAVVYEEHIVPWRFDTARNVAMDHIPEDVDICVSNDLDEIFEPGWRAKLEAAWGAAHTRAKYWFVWSHNSDQTAEKRFPMEKIHRRYGFRWVHPVHEVLQYNGSDADQTVWVDGLVLHHYPDLSKARSQYLPLLELSVKENPQDDRAVFWLGREYVFHQKYDEAIKTLKQHLALPGAIWNEERSASMRFLAQSYGAKGDLQTQRAWLFRAVAECPQVREPYLALVKFGYNQADWPLVCAMAEKGLAVQHRSESYLMQAESWGSAFYDYAAIGAYHLGLYEKAEQYAKLACARSPADARLQSNLVLIQKRRAAASKEEEA